MQHVYSTITLIIIIGIIAIVIIAAGFDIGDTSDCNNGEIPYTTSNMWGCISLPASTGSTINGSYNDTWIYTTFYNKSEVDTLLLGVNGSSYNDSWIYTTIDSLPNLSTADVDTAVGNYSSKEGVILPNISKHEQQITSLPNLSHAQIAEAINNGSIIRDYNTSWKNSNSSYSNNCGNATISMYVNCSNIGANGGDTDFCNDATGSGGGITNNSVANLSKLYVQDGAYLYGTNEAKHTAFLFCDFALLQSTTMCGDNYAGSAGTGGVSSTVPSEQNINFTFGIVSLFNYSYMTGTDIIKFNGSEEFKIHFSTLGGEVATNSSIAYFGFIDTTTYTESVDGAYFEVINSNSSNPTYYLVAKQSSNSVRNASVNYTLNRSTWYYASIKVGFNALNVTYKIYNNTGYLLWNVTLVNNIPSALPRYTGAGIRAWANSHKRGTAPIIYIDYLATEIEKPFRTLI